MSAQQSAIIEANPAPAVSPRGRFFSNQTFHFETLRNAGYARSVTTRIFDRASGGGEHCQCGNTSLVHAAVFDWLLQTFPVV